MATRRSLLLFLALVLLPNPVRADGIIDWIEKMSGPKLKGVGFDLHLFCATADRAIPLCEKVVYLDKTASRDIKHIFDLRAVWYWQRDDVSFENINDKRRVHAQRLEAFYHYRIVPAVDVGSGVGYFRITAPDEEFEPFTTGIVTPLSVSAAPFVGLNRLKGLKILTFRFEETYFAGGLKGTQFGVPNRAFDTGGGEWNRSYSIVFDFTRLR
jgi:hypothetical protein